MAAIVDGSGPHLFDAAFLGHADDAWWVGVVRRAPPGAAMPLEIGFRLGTRVPLYGLWRDPAGGLWVASENGVRRSGDPWGPEAGEWELLELDAALRGITGVDGRCVLTWGIRPSDGVHVLRLFNGARWNPVGGPEIAITAADLSAPDRIWIAGEDGAARWDGEGWQVLDAPGLVALHAPTDDRVFVADERGHLSRVVPDGLEPWGRVPGARAVAWWRGALWIGAGEGGLWRCEPGASPSVVRADRRCVVLEAHADSLLVICDDLVSATEDGERFPGGCRGSLDGLRLPAGR